MIIMYNDSLKTLSDIYVKGVLLCKKQNIEFFGRFLIHFLQFLGGNKLEITVIYDLK